MHQNIKSIDGSGLNIVSGLPLDHIRLAFSGRQQHAQESIAKAAMALECGRIFAVDRPGRHHHIINTVGELALATATQIGDAIQGFVTTKGRFVDRREGLRLAERSKQLIRKTQPADQLFSEDLWR